jgi:hypothetical protein
MTRRISFGRTLAAHAPARLASLVLLAAAGLAACHGAVAPCAPGASAPCSCAPGQAGTALCGPSGTAGTCSCRAHDQSELSGVDASGAPLGLVAEGAGPGEIDLHWRPVPAAGAAYRLYRDGHLLATTRDPRHEDTTVTPGASHTYTVTVSLKAGESPPSAPATATAHQADEDGDVKPGEFRSYGTLQSLGFEWDLSGDANHDATASVRYRVAGAAAWHPALPLMRVDLDGQNMLAGSVLFLEPSTEYEVLLYVTDPDGGARTRRLKATTRAVPVLPTGGRTFHVVPGDGGGDGSEANPFRGVPAAAAGARADDVMLLHGGHYGGRVSLAVGGEPGHPVAWKAAGDGDPIFAGVAVEAGHQRLEGLRIEAGGGYEFPIGLRTANAPADVAVVRCTFVGNHYGIWLNGGGSDWYIADNTIVGDNVVGDGSFSGEGVEFQHTNGHTLAYNSISHVGDGNSYCSYNCDIVGNDIFDTSDDGIEPDDGGANIRLWGNRLTNTGHNGVSFQPMSGAPWYIIRNQIIGQSEGPLKLQGADRFVLLHNTIVEWSHMTTTGGEQILNALSRNNVWISVTGGTLFNTRAGVPGWETSLDYDGFDWAGTAMPFKYKGVVDGDLASFVTASGLEPHGVALPRSCFPTLDVPRPPPASVPPQVVELAPGCPAVDAGVVLPNVNDGYLGAAPDLGAYEQGAPLPHYGPRAP